jgi:hypothetical protein
MAETFDAPGHYLFKKIRKHTGVPAGFFPAGGVTEYGPNPRRLTA